MDECWRVREGERGSNSIYSISEVQAVSAIIKLAEWSHYNLDIHVSISNIRQSVISSDTLQYHAILFFPSALYLYYTGNLTAVDGSVLGFIMLESLKHF